MPRHRECGFPVAELHDSLFREFVTLQFAAMLPLVHHECAVAIPSTSSISLETNRIAMPRWASFSINP